MRAQGRSVAIHRRSRIWFSLLAVVPLAALQACSWLEVQAQPGAVLFQDDFSRTSSGWDRYRDSVYRSDYQDGSFRFEILAADTDAWANPGLDFGDVRIEVDALKVDGPDDNRYGILCRYQDPLNFYFFLISSDGYAGIGLRQDGQSTLLSADTMLPRDAVLQGSAVNHLRADCVGNELRLLVNGFSVAEAQASEWARGDVGLLTGTGAQPGVVIDFDNFSVLQP
jgi:hypothetical protein